jgi:tight adherence protein B
MIEIALVVSIAIFAIAVLVFLAMKTGPSKPLKQRLEAIERETSKAPPEVAATDIRRAEQFGGWLNRWMVRVNVAPWARLLLYQAEVKTPPESLLAMSVAGWVAAGAVVYWRTDAVAPAVLLSAAVIPAPLLYVYRRRAKRFERFEQQLPEALDLLVSALRVGHSLITGVGALAQVSPEPIAREFRTLFEEQNFGLDLRSAMANLAMRVPLQDVRIFVAATLIQKESGGNLAEVLDKVAQTTRERFRLRKQIRVHTAPGRLTGLILSLFPLVLGLGMYLVDPETMSVLWTRPIGLKLLYGAVGMIVVGCLIIRKIVDIRV